MADLFEFVRESNRIEGILREPTEREIGAHEDFLAEPHIGVMDLERFVSIVAVAPLRDRQGMNVFVESHRPPEGGPHIRGKLSDLLGWMMSSDPTPWEVHVRYEKLHPFMDGNGRSGRVLWAWLRSYLGRHPFALGFLHSSYYEALEASRPQEGQPS